MRTAVEIRDRAADLARTALPHREGDPAAYDVDVDLGGGRRLTGTVTPVFGRRTVSVTYSRLGGRQLMASWIPLLALGAALPDDDWSALSIGRGEEDGRIAQRLLGRPAEPMEALRDVVRLYDAGRREPLPLPVKTSFAWAEARRAGKDPITAAGAQWQRSGGAGGGAGGDNTDHAHAKIWGRGAPLDVLLGVPHPGEEVAGETTRLGALAARLWQPMLRAEVR